MEIKKIDLRKLNSLEEGMLLVMEDLIISVDPKQERFSTARRGANNSIIDAKLRGRGY